LNVSARASSSTASWSACTPPAAAAGDVADAEVDQLRGRVGVGERLVRLRISAKR
jgi:hypothetical protein